MGSVEKRIRQQTVTNKRTGEKSLQDVERWYARYRTPDGKQRVKVFDRERAAKDFLTSVESSKLTGSFIDPVRSRVTVGALADEWLQVQAGLAPTTRERYEGIISKHIRPAWGTVALSSVTHSDVQRWVSGLGLSAASVRKTHRVLSMVLDWAVKDERIARNPAAGISLPRVQAAEKRFLTHEQVAQLADLCGPEYRVMVLFLAYTGLRWGEMAALRVHRLDLLRRRALVAESVTPVKGAMTWGPTKGHERREVPIPAFLVRELSRHIEGKARDSLVFVGSRGAVMRSGTFRRAALTAAAESLGLCEPKLDDQGRAVFTTDADGVRHQVFTGHLHPHELRHTAASLAIASGADVKVVQQMLGHKSATMTLDQYGHLFGDRLDVVADALDAARSSALAAAASVAVIA